MGKYEFRISVPARGDQPTETVHLANRTTEIRKTETYGHYLVVIGSIGTTAVIVTVLDLSGGGEKLSFLCWYADVSPERRFIVFKRFHPRFTDADLISDVIGVVDLDALPKERQVMATNPDDTVPPFSAGHPVYPEVNLRTGAFDLRLGDVRHMVYPTFLWRDAHTLVLVDTVTHWPGGAKRLAVCQVDLHGKPNPELDCVPLSKRDAGVLQRSGIKALQLEPEKSKLEIQLYPSGKLVVGLP